MTRHNQDLSLISFVLFATLSPLVAFSPGDAHKVPGPAGVLRVLESEARHQSLERFVNQCVPFSSVYCLDLHVLRCIFLPTRYCTALRLDIARKYPHLHEMNVLVVGMPNVGKSTLLNALRSTGIPGRQSSLLVPSATACGANTDSLSSYGEGPEDVRPARPHARSFNPLEAVPGAARIRI